MKRKKRRIRPWIKYTMVIILLFTLLIKAYYFLLDSLKEPVSINQDAEIYKSETCYAFYPKEYSQKGLDYVVNLCNQVKDTEDNQEYIFDYQTNQIGDFIEIDYGNDNKYLITKDYQDYQLTNLNDRARMIISDYLRYTLKSENRDEAYTAKFMEETYYPNIEAGLFENVYLDIENIHLHSKEYDIDVSIPLKYIGNAIDVDLNQTEEEYIKPIYINPNRKAIAITFDDGPSLKPECTNKVINELYKYDATGTFFVVGRQLYDDTEPLLEKGIKLGNEYGSHSCTHRNLKTLSSDEIEEEIMDVVYWFKEKFNYDIKLYRPPYGAYDDNVDAIIPLPAILWDIDSIDWKLRDADAIIGEIGSDIPNNSVLLLHDIHATSIEAVVDKGLIKNLIDQGYQLVNVSEIAKMRNVELKQGTHFCWDK